MSDMNRDISKHRMQRMSFAERRKSIQLQVQKLVKEVKTTHHEQACQTHHCKNTAKKLFSNLNTNVDPCDDFFKFSCDGWMQNNPRPANKHRWNVLTISPSHFLFGTELLSPELSTSEKKEFEILHRKLLKAVIEQFNHTIPEIVVDTDITEIIEFEKRLESLSSKDFLEKRLRLFELEHKFHNIKWFQIFYEIFQLIDESLSKQEPFYVLDIDYFEKLGKILHNTNAR
ncbi:endothelin-converting enzyme 2-like protein [Leptotrombidium deliense]|uniref:Endothelin-converting enzyme 2-like protein n=1 Tax=Leptotrombidium deliense TaxID=299467 RepID=A0A443SCZ2_9ACAR|nr:endothelin-converting enzyme 2-like protein [Leptotrombidium deliense]